MTTELSSQEVSRMLLNELPIPKELFQHTDKYIFPSLLLDEKGIFTGKCKGYHTYDLFSNKGEVIFTESDENRDYELENHILNNEITLIDIDLDKAPNINLFFESTECRVYPESIKDIAAIYDTLFICDYLLKYIHRMLMQLMVIGLSTEQIVTSNYLISYKPVEGKYPISNVYRRAGFTKLLNTIRFFSLKNKDQSTLIKESYEECRNNKNEIRVNLNFPQMDYSLDERYLQFHTLTPNVNITYGNDEVPLYLTFVKKFIEEHYQDIKTAFPIYNRLENIYRLCALVRFKQNKFQTNENHPSYDLVYTRTFPDRIMCCGGITLVPKLFVKIPFRDHPLIQKKEKVKECRKAFDNAGLICAFAPKLKIRDCLDQNLKDFHECLED